MREKLDRQYIYTQKIRGDHMMQKTKCIFLAQSMYIFLSYECYHLQVFVSCVLIIVLGLLFFNHMGMKKTFLVEVLPHHLLGNLQYSVCGQLASGMLCPSEVNISFMKTLVNLLIMSGQAANQWTLLLNTLIQLQLNSLHMHHISNSSV